MEMDLGDDILEEEELVAWPEAVPTPDPAHAGVEGTRGTLHDEDHMAWMARLVAIERGRGPRHDEEEMAWKARLGASAATAEEESQLATWLNGERPPVQQESELATWAQLEASWKRREDERIMKKWDDALPKWVDDEEALARAIAASLDDERTERGMGDLMAADVMEFNDEWCLECHTAFDDHDHTPTWSTCHQRASPDLMPGRATTTDPCIGPCRRCRDAKEITVCKRCGATGVRFLDDVA
jgi:hypothetical protein